MLSPLFPRGTAREEMSKRQTPPPERPPHCAHMDLYLFIMPFPFAGVLRGTCNDEPRPGLLFVLGRGLADRPSRSSGFSTVSASDASSSPLAASASSNSFFQDVT